MLFLSRSLLEHHQIVLAPCRSETSVSMINQVSFEIETLRKLIESFQALTELGSIRNGSHEPWRKLVAVCPDPEGNTIELFVRTDWYVPPHATTGLDLSQPEELIFQQTEIMAKDTPGSKTWDVQRQEFQKRMNGES